MSNSKSKKHVQPIPAKKVAELQALVDKEIAQRFSVASSAGALGAERGKPSPARDVCECEITIEHIQRAFNRYISKNIRIVLPGGLWVESGSVLNPGELFAGAVLIFNHGEIYFEDVVFNLTVRSSNALLQVPDSYTCRTGWYHSSSQLNSGDMVRSIFMSIGGIGPGFSSYKSIHFVGRAQTAGTLDLVSAVVGKFSISGLSKYSAIQDAQQSYDIID